MGNNIFQVGFWGKKVSFFYIKVQNWQHGINLSFWKQVRQVRLCSSSPELQASTFYLVFPPPCTTTSVPGPAGLGLGQTQSRAPSQHYLSWGCCHPLKFGRDWEQQSLTVHGSLGSLSSHTPSQLQWGHHRVRERWSTLSSHFIFFLLICVIRRSQPVVLKCLRTALSHPCHQPSSIL